MSMTTGSGAKAAGKTDSVFSPLTRHCKLTYFPELDGADPETKPKTGKRKEISVSNDELEPEVAGPETGKPVKTKKPKKPVPNWFVAFPISSQEILQKFTAVQVLKCRQVSLASLNLALPNLAYLSLAYYCLNK